MWFTSGLSIAAWIKPVLQFALPVALVRALLSLAITPWSQAQGAEYQRLLASRDEVSAVTPGVFRESCRSDRLFYEGTPGMLDYRAVDFDRYMLPIALPLAVLIMGLFAIPLAFVNPRSGRS